MTQSEQKTVKDFLTTTPSEAMKLSDCPLSRQLAGAGWQELRLAAGFDEYLVEYYEGLAPATLADSNSISLSLLSKVKFI